MNIHITVKPGDQVNLAELQEIGAAYLALEWHGLTTDDTVRNLTAENLACYCNHAVS